MQPHGPTVILSRTSKDFSAILEGATIFSKIDLICGYRQVPVAEADICKTVVITPFGLFEFLRMPFGLENAAQAFQRLMDSVCNSLDHVFVYLDDILVASPTPQALQQHLRQLFQRLANYGFVINVAKCEFARSHLDFLGHRIDKTGATPLPASVEAMRNFAKPLTTKNLQRFLGMLNFYHRFISGAAALMAPLYEAASAKQKLPDWTNQLSNTFAQTQRAFAQVTLLHHPMKNALTALTVDASDKDVGGVLEQFEKGQRRPLAFFSRQLRKPETK